VFGCPIASVQLFTNVDMASFMLAVLLRCCRFISFAYNTSTVSPLTLLFNLEMTSVIVVSFPIRFLATPFFLWKLLVVRARLLLILLFVMHQ